MFANAPQCKLQTKVRNPSFNSKVTHLLLMKVLKEDMNIAHRIPYQNFYGKNRFMSPISQ